MKYLKAIVFIFGVMLFGASLKMEPEGDVAFWTFICYGFFAASIIVAWSEIKGLILELKK